MLVLLDQDLIPVHIRRKQEANQVKKYSPQRRRERREKFLFASVIYRDKQKYSALNPRLCALSDSVVNHPKAGKRGLDSGFRRNDE
jgi:hypothetical protein